MIKVFMKDMTSRRDMVKYFILAVLLAAGIDTYLKNNNLEMAYNFDMRLTAYIILGFALTIFFFIRTYTTSTNTLAYYALPVKRKKVNANLILSAIIDTYVRKILILFAVAIPLGAPIKFFIGMTLLTPLIVILATIPVASNISKGKKITTLVFGLIDGILILYLIFKMEVYLISAVTLIIFLYFTYSYYLEETFFTAGGENVKESRNFDNYFLKFIMAEKVYLINTLGIFLMVTIVILFFTATMNLPIALAVATVNTPLLTILSSDEGLRDYNNLLPNKHRSLDKDYMKVLIAYFTLVHLWILILSFRNINFKLVIGLIFFAIIDSLGAYIFEEKYPIKNKKTTTDIWRHPRKYIMGVIVMLASFIYFVIF